MKKYFKTRRNENWKRRSVLFSLWLALIAITGDATAQNSATQVIWVSDEIEAPLRDAPQLNAKIVGLLPAGQRLTALEEREDYIRIQTADGKSGWLSSYYILREQSVHDKYLPMTKELAQAQAKITELSQALDTAKQSIASLEQSKTAAEKSADEIASRAKTDAGNVQKLGDDNKLLQQKLTEQSEKMAELAKALDVAKQKASTARTRYLSLVKVSENAVDIDKQNRSLQEKAVQFEQEIQRLKNENQTLKSQIGKKEFIIGALTILGGVLIGYVLSVMMPPRGRRMSSYPSSL